ncbi:MAG: carbon-nitrogen hydrolase family protein [Acidobacteriota bacterium]
MRVYLSRWVCLDVESNLRRLAAESAEAATTGAELIVFPESFLHGYTRELDPDEARDAFAAISARYPAPAFAFGSLNEDRRNRMTVWQGGSELARYDKVHLFAPNLEPEIWDEGDCYAAAVVDDWTWGLMICNDLRFPEQARMLRLKGRCQGLLVVAWWPWRRDHVWRTLLARPRDRERRLGRGLLRGCLGAPQGKIRRRRQLRL